MTVPPTALTAHWQQIERRLRQQITDKVPAEHQAAANSQADAMLADVRGRTLLTADEARALMASRGYTHFKAGDGAAYPIADWQPYGDPEGYYGFAVADKPNVIEDARYDVATNAQGVPCLFAGQWPFLGKRDLCASCGAVLDPANIWQVRGQEAALGPFCSAKCAQEAAARRNNGSLFPVYREPTDTELQQTAGLGGNPS